MARRKSRRSRRSRRGLGCMGCGITPSQAGSMAGLGFGFDEPRPVFKYALYAALAYFAYTKFVKPQGGVAGLLAGLSGGNFFTDDLNTLSAMQRNSADASLNRPVWGGTMVEVPRGY